MVMLPAQAATSSSSNVYFGMMARPAMSTEMMGQKIDMLMSLAPSMAPGSPASMALQSNIAAMQTIKKRQEVSEKLDKQYPGTGLLVSAYKECLKALPDLEPNSQQASMYKLFARLFGQMQGIPQKEIDKDLLITERLALASVVGALFTISANLEPESPTAMNIQMRIADIQKQDQALEKKMKSL